MSNPLKNPGVIAATVAGGSIGIATGAMIKGEESESRGDSFSQQTGAFITGGVSHGVIGTGLGFGISGTAMALKHILGK